MSVIGSVPQPALALAMQKAHVFILSSFFEGLPLVLLEAMSCGCRVIATEVPGVRELFETNFSSWVKTLPTPPLQQVDKPLPGTKGAFEDHLAVLLRIQIQAVLDAPVIQADEIRRFLEPFTWPRVFGRIEHVCQNLIAERKTAPIAIKGRRRPKRVAVLSDRFPITGSVTASRRPGLEFFRKGAWATLFA